MKHAFILDSQNPFVAHSIDGRDSYPITLETFLARFAPRTINLGLLPPVVKLITPVFHDGGRNQISILVERSPCKQQLVFIDESKRDWDYDYDADAFTSVHNLTLPWHSCIFNFTVNTDDTLIFRDVGLFFHKSEIQSEADLNNSFFCVPYLPNVYVHFYANLFSNWQGNMCWGEPDNKKIPFKDFSKFYYEFMKTFWGTAFNDELNDALQLYGTKLLKKPNASYYRKILDRISEFTYEEAINSLIPYTEISNNYIVHGTGGYLLKSPSFNPPFTLSQLLG